jgi:hypothetical protein
LWRSHEVASERESGREKANWSSSSIHSRRSASKRRAVSASRLTKRQKASVASAVLERPVADDGGTEPQPTSVLVTGSKGAGVVVEAMVLVLQNLNWDWLDLSLAEHRHPPAPCCCRVLRWP